MKNIKFAPWIGQNYRNAPLGRRILVLGESHYQWEDNAPISEWSGLTSAVINEQLDGHYKKAFWTHIAVAFLNRLPNLEEKRAFWHSVAFYNYVQESAGIGARVRPTEAMFTASAPAFFEVLESLQPEIIVALGYELWARLPKAQSGDEAVETGCGAIQTRVYSYVGGFAHACSIKHPSSGFNGRHWYPRIMRIVQSS